MSRKEHAAHANHERWLVSYADFITLLFAFFVVMFATAQTDKSKAQQVSDSVKKALAGQPLSEVVSAILGKGRKAKPHAEHAPLPATSKTVEGEAGHLAELWPLQRILAK